jgi:hypothetical protein
LSSQGPTAPASSTNNSGVGTIDWTNPSDALTSTGATVTLTDAEVSHSLWATNPGFTVPGGSTIDGIQADWNAAGSTASASKYILDNEIKLIIGGAKTGTDQKSATKWPVGGAARSYGGPSSLWGATPSVSDVNASNFGVAISAIGTTASSDPTGTIKSLTLKVYYTAAAGGAATPAAFVAFVDFVLLAGVLAPAARGVVCLHGAPGLILPTWLQKQPRLNQASLVPC